MIKYTPDGMHQTQDIEFNEGESFDAGLKKHGWSPLDTLALKDGEVEFWVKDNSYLANHSNYETWNLVYLATEVDYYHYRNVFLANLKQDTQLEEISERLDTLTKVLALVNDFDWHTLELKLRKM